MRRRILSAFCQLFRKSSAWLGKRSRPQISWGITGIQLFLLEAHIIGKRRPGVATLILRDLSKGAKKQVLSELDKSMDEHDSLYLRIDRQSIVRELTLSDEEPVRVKLKPKFRVGGRVSMKASYEEMIR